MAKVELPKFSSAMASLDRAMGFYRAQLKQSAAAIGYLKGRVVHGDTAARYRLGFAPGGWQNLQQAFEDYKSQSLVECGLVAVSSKKRHFDRFRERIMFPVIDDVGCVIGFGGRVLDEAEPKYLNSPETPLFKKSQVLYGLHQALPSIVETSTVYVVEGYFDVISLAQCGITNSVATLGTATSPAHVARLLMAARRIVFCFDGDSAGRRAAAHALDACLPYVDDATEVAFLFLPREHDPDSFVRTFGADPFIELAHGAVPLDRYFVVNAMQGVSLQHAEGRARLVAAARPGLQRIRAPLLLRRLLDVIALHTRFTVSDVAGLCQLEEKALFAIDGQ